MLKLLGTVLIFSGTIGASFWVRQSVEEHMKLLYELRQFLFKLSEDMRYTNQPMAYLLQQKSNSRDERILLLCQELADRLLKGNIVSPQKEWDNIFREKRKEFQLTREEMELISEAGNAFFGKCREENQMYFELLMNRLDFMIEGKRNEQAEKQKVLQTVVLMGGAMLILILI